MPTIDLPLGPIDYADEGDPTGVPVVAVHGFMADGDLWASTAAALGDRVRLLRPTLPLGAHRTPLVLDPGPGDVVDVLLAFMDALGLEDPILLGNDTGGAICQLTVARRPDRVGGMVLTNCDAFDQFPPFPFNALLPMSRVPGLMEVLMQGLRVPLLRHTFLYGPLSSRRHEDLWAQFTRPYFADAAIRRQTLGLLRRARPKDLLAATDVLRSWDRETLLVWGQRDLIFRPALGRRLAQALGARLVEVAGARAFVPLETPDLLADHVAAFAAETARARVPAGEAA